MFICDYICFIIFSDQACHISDNKNHLSTTMYFPVSTCHGVWYGMNFVIYFVHLHHIFTGLIWIRQQVEWECKHAERCEAGS